MASSLNFLIITLLIIGCCLATYSDIRYGKISNKLIMIYGSVPFLLNALQIMRDDAIVTYAVNALIVIIIAILLYSFHVWAGGDCKMMIWIALSTLADLYWIISGKIYVFWWVYIFIFSFGFIYLCVDNIRLFFCEKDILNKEFIEELKTSLYRYLRTIIYLAAIGHIYLIFIFPHTKFPMAVYTIACIVIVLVTTHIKLLANKWIVGVVALIDLICVILTRNITINTLWYSYVVVIILMILRTISKVFNYEDIKTKDIEPGMILSQESSILFQQSRVQGLPGISDETLKSRLTRDEADAVKRWGKSKYGLKIIRIVKKMPFAIFITIGWIVYFILGCVYFDN